MNQQGKKSILIVDDVKLFQLFLKLSFEPEDYNLLFAERGKEVLDIVMHKSIDLLILDLKLPDMDGLEVLRNIRTITRDMQSIVRLENLPVIILTAYPTEEARHEAEKLGVAAFLSKPIKKESIRRIVRKALEEHPEHRLQRKLILCVDSEPRVQKLYEGALATDEWGVICSSNGLEALEAVEFKNPDLIIIELNLPEMNGFEFIQGLKESNRDIPIIVVSSLADKESIQKAKKMGVRDYLTKPFYLDELRIRIKEALKEKVKLKNV